MKKLFAVLILLFAVTFIGAPICANTAHADQGFYGNVYAYTYELGNGDPDLTANSCYVSNAVVE